MRLPPARGKVTELVTDVLSGSPGVHSVDVRTVVDAVSRTDDVLTDEDLQLALFCLYELHYSGIDGVDDGWEWDPQVIQLRRHIEQAFEARLRQSVPASAVDRTGRPDQQVADRLFEMAEGEDGPSVSSFIARDAEVWHAKEFLVHKSVYQLKEGDPHTWAIPRLTGRPKAALVEIQADEYGGGQLGKMHYELFATTMSGLGLDSRFGAYLDVVPALSLASVNMMSMFGLNRRLRGAIVGHLAIYEMGSALPNAKYARGFRRLGFDAPVTDFFDEHVEADSVHEQIAGYDLAGGLVEQDPTLLEDVLFGAASALLLGSLLEEWQLAAWRDGRSSLLRPLSEADVAGLTMAAPR